MSSELTILRDSIWRWFRRRQEQIGVEKGSRSIVLLQRSGKSFSEGEVIAAAERGWSRLFDGKQDPMYCVVQAGNVTLIKAGRLVVNMLQAHQAYLGNPEEVAVQLPNEEQQNAWRQHRAWVSFDLMNAQDATRLEAYSSLAKFALGCGDENCAGIYLPRERLFAPNTDGEAEQMIRMLIRKELPL